MGVHLRLLVTAATLLAVAAPATAGAAAPAQRPHSRVVTYDRGDVRIERLEAQVARSGGRLHVRVAVAVRNMTGRRQVRYVHVGRCLGGSLIAPRCPATSVLRIALDDADASRTVTRTVTLHQPPPGVDAIAVSVARSARETPQEPFRSDGQLLLRGNAWRGTGAGRAYGVRFPQGLSGERATRLSFDIPVTSPGHAYMSVVWDGTDAPGAPTTIARCTGADCVPRSLKPSRFRSGPQHFGARFGFQIEQADAVQLLVEGADGAELIRATLPWPA